MSQMSMATSISSLPSTQELSRASSFKSSQEGMSKSYKRSSSTSSVASFASSIAGTAAASTSAPQEESGGESATEASAAATLTRSTDSNIIIKVREPRKLLAMMIVVVLKHPSSSFHSPPVKVGMVGDAQIGKTSLMVRYVEGSFNEVGLLARDCTMSEERSPLSHTKKYEPLRTHYPTRTTYKRSVSTLWKRQLASATQRSHSAFGI